jgi:hypothetical protein
VKTKSLTGFRSSLTKKRESFALASGAPFNRLSQPMVAGRTTKGFVQSPST